MSPVQDIFNWVPGGSTQARIFLYFFGSAILAFILAPFIINLLYKFNIRRVAKGDVISKWDEEQGKLGTAIMGGLIVIITTLLITLTFNWERKYTYLPIGALLLSASIGGIDDILNIFGKVRKQPKPIKLHIKLALVHKSWWKKIYYFLTIPWAVYKRSLLFIGSKPKSGLQVHEKILVQAFIGITVGCWVYYKNDLSDVWIPYIARIDFIESFINALPLLSVNAARSSIDIGWLMIPFVALTIMTVTNAVNISDGMDGLSGGLVLMAFLAYAVIAFNLSQLAGIPDFKQNSEIYFGYRHIAYLCATIAGSLLAYLYFNVKPARVQMGDVGSLGLGTILSIIAIVLHRELTLLFICGVFLFNGIFSRIIQKIYRKITGKKLFLIIPLHYHFERKGWNEEKVVMRFWIISAILTTIGVWIAGL